MLKLLFRNLELYFAQIRPVETMCHSTESKYHSLRTCYHHTFAWTCVLWRAIKLNQSCTDHWLPPFSYLQLPFTISQSILPLHPIKLPEPHLWGQRWGWDSFSCLLPLRLSAFNLLFLCKWAQHGNKLYNQQQKKSKQIFAAVCHPLLVTECLWMSPSSYRGKGGIAGPYNHPQDFPRAKLPTFEVEKQFACVKDVFLGK